MANIKSAQKRARQAIKRRGHNMALRSRMRTHLKRVLNAVKAGDKAAAEASFKEAMPVLDSMVNKGMVHKNKAARHKSRLNDRIRQLGA